MGLFSDNQEGFTLQSDHKKDLAQLGGMGAGILAGQLGALPFDAIYQKKLLQQGIANTENIRQSQTDWDILFRLYKGQMDIDDLPEEKRSYYTDLLKNKKDDLNYFSHRPDEARRAMDELDRGKVLPLFGKDQRVKMTRNFPAKVRSPVARTFSPVLGLAGFYGAGKFYDHVTKTDETDD